MELAGLSREQQEFSRRAVTALILAVVIGYYGWHLSHALSMSASNALSAAAATHEHSHHETSEHATSHAHPPAFYSVIPFAALLLCIAFLPLFHRTEHWWERNRNRLLVSSAMGTLTLLYYALLYNEGVADHASHTTAAAGWPSAFVVFKNALLVEYIPFITLLFSLYVISGGVAVRGHLVGRPVLNTAILGIGGLLASLIGTTGAAMLLVRPLLKANANRRYVTHTLVFFIFVVCNTGGCLLPIGDPPLFLGFLRGVHFTWTLSLWPMWLSMNLALLAIYFLWDSLRYRREDRSQVEAAPQAPEPFAVAGTQNFLWLAGVIACVALLDPSRPVPGTGWHAPLYFREVAMLGLTALSLLSTPATIRHENAFNYDAILEVAALFVGIFICMQAPIQILHHYGPTLGLDTPTEFFWGTGMLSSFLDNAPTYVVFFETARTLATDGPTVAGVAVPSLIAISLGAVFMGAMTYIGNGPNFMVKAIAEKNNVRMPSFFGYMGYSCLILLPLFVGLTAAFL